MMTLTLPPSSDENLRILPQNLKSSKIQEILGINNENDNSNSTSTNTPR